MPIELCKSCLHPKKDHKFAKLGQTYTSSKFRIGQTGHEVRIVNFDGYCTAQPLCTCIAYVPGGTKKALSEKLKRNDEVLKNYKHVEIPDVRQRQQQTFIPAATPITRRGRKTSKPMPAQSGSTKGSSPLF